MLLHNTNSPKYFFFLFYSYLMCCTLRLLFSLIFFILFSFLFSNYSLLLVIFRICSSFISNVQLYLLSQQTFSTKISRKNNNKKISVFLFISIITLVRFENGSYNILIANTSVSSSPTGEKLISMCLST